MKAKTEELIERILSHETITKTTKPQLEAAIKMLSEEISMNESCNLRTEENEEELKRLYDAKCRCRQRLLMIEGGLMK